jgi:RNA polymerase sigma factor (sigma-70 family)
MTKDDRILRGLCEAHRAGFPHAAVRLQAVFAYLVFEVTGHTTITDPTQEQLREIRGPRLGVAWEVFAESILEIAKPDFKVPANYYTWLRGRIERAVKHGRRKEKKVFGPSERTAGRKKKEKQQIVRQAHLDTERLPDERTTAATIWDELDEEALTDREREVVTLLAAGNSYQEAADLLVVSTKTVQRELATIRRRVKDDSAHALAV